MAGFELNPCLVAEYTLPESTSLGGVDVAMPDSSQSLPPLMHMGYAARHPGRSHNEILDHTRGT